MKKLTQVYYKGECYYVVENDQKILCAINKKYVKNGVLTKHLNGFDMLVDIDKNTLPDMINRIKHHVEIELFVALHNLSYNNENDVRKIVEFSMSLPF